LEVYVAKEDFYSGMQGGKQYVDWDEVYTDGSTRKLEGAACFASMGERVSHGDKKGLAQVTFYPDIKVPSHVLTWWAEWLESTELFKFLREKNLIDVDLLDKKKPYATVMGGMPSSVAFTVLSLCRFPQEFPDKVYKSYRFNKDFGVEDANIAVWLGNQGGWGSTSRLPFSDMSNANNHNGLVGAPCDSFCHVMNDRDVIIEMFERCKENPFSFRRNLSYMGEYFYGKGPMSFGDRGFDIVKWTDKAIKGDADEADFPEVDLKKATVEEVKEKLKNSNAFKTLISAIDKEVSKWKMPQAKKSK
jgi:hypothetical protein